MGIEIAILGLTVSLSTAISVAMAALSVAMVLTMKKPSPGSTARGQAERKQVLRSATAPEDVVYGMTVKSGLLAFAEEEVGGWQDNTPDPETNQGYVEWLHQVIVLASHPVDRIGRIWFNDDEIQTFGANATYELLNNPTAANAFLLENCPSWKSDMVGKGLASLRLSMLFNQRLYPAGIPNVKVEVWGKKIFDPRDNKTKWSDNAALVLLDFVRTHPKFRMKDARIDWDSFKAAANICDEIVTGPTGALEKRYTINGAFDLNERPSGVIDDMLMAMAGELTWFGGKIGVQAGAYYGPATTTISSGDILDDISITPEASAKDRINTINGTFIDPDQLWVETDFPPIVVSEWVAEDGEERKEDLKLRFVSSHYQAQRLANIRLRRARLGRTVQFKMNMKGYAIRPGTYIQLKVPEVALDQELRVVEWEHDPQSGIVTITARQDGTAIWDDCIGKPIDRPPLVNLPSGGPAVPSDIKFQVETIGEVVQGLLTWRNSAMTAYTNINIKRGNVTIYTAQEPRNLHRLGGLPVGDYVAEMRAVGMTGGMSDKATIAFSVATPAAVTAVDIRAGNWDITLTPRIATVSTYGTEFEFWYYRAPLAVGVVETTAQRLGTGAQMTHSGLQTGTVHYYWVRAINAYGKGSMFALQASTTRDVDSVLDVIAGSIGAESLKDELKQEISKITAIETEIGQLVTPGQLSAAVKTETDERISQDTALGKRIDTVTASASTTAAGLQTEVDARASADTALGKRIDTVTATAASNTSAIQTETQARVTADDALASQITTLRTTVGNNTSAIQTETTARANADSAMAAQISTLQATTGSNTAAIQSEATARANADTAIGKRIDTVQATVGSNTAAIQTTATAGTTNDGKTMNAMWSTKASINDVVGGFGLMAEKDPDGVTRIKFIVDADIFAILGRNGDKRAPFVIKDGVVYMNKLLLDDAEIGSVIAKYINVQDLVAVKITASTIKSSDNGASFSLLPDGTMSCTKATIKGAITATSGSFTGTVNANAGTMNNITIAENCNVLGTVYANRIVGDVTATKRIIASIPPGAFSVSVNVQASNLLRDVVVSGIFIKVTGPGDFTRTLTATIRVNGVQVSSFTVSARTLGAIDSSAVGGAHRLSANVAGTVTVEFSGGSSAGTISLEGAIVQVFKADTGTFA